MSELHATLLNVSHLIFMLYMNYTYIISCLMGNVLFYVVNSNVYGTDCFFFRTLYVGHTQYGANCRYVYY